MILGLLLFVAVCGAALVIGILAQRGLSDPLHQAFNRQTGYVRFMQDKHELNQIGYAQQLTRRLSGFAVFGVSFSTLSVIGGAIFLLGPAVAAGGPAVVGFGYPILALFGIATACSMAFFASKVPTAGGCYHWAKAAGGKRLGLAAGWLHLAGNLLMTVTMNVICAQWISRMVEARFGYEASTALICGILILLILSQAIAGLGGVGVLSGIFRVSAWLQVLCVLAVLAGLVALAWPSAYPLEMLYGFLPVAPSEAAAVSGHEPVLVLGMLLLQRLFLGADSAAQTAEETHDPRASVPWAIFLSVVYTFIFGFVLFSMMLLQFPGGTSDFPGYNGLGHWVVAMLAGNWGWAINTIVVFAIALAGWGSGLGSMTASVRSLFAMSRDGAPLPWGRKLAEISERFRSPVAAVIAVAAAVLGLSLGIGLTEGASLGNETLIQLVGSSLIALHLSYAIPIALKLHAKRWSKSQALHQSWQPGRLGLFLDRVSVIWLISSAGIALYYMNGFALILLLAGAALLIAGVEAAHRRSHTLAAVQAKGHFRFNRRTIEEIIRIERKFSQQ